MPGTWFLPSDFTFTTEGPLRLSMVIPHWSRPTTVFAEMGSGSSSAVTLPAVKTTVERNRAFNRSKPRSNSVGMWAKFEGLASGLANTETGKSRITDYSTTDHKIRTFVDPLMPETVSTIANLPTVQKRINSGMFGKRAVYVVTGLRIATSSFTVTEEDSSNLSIEVEGSGPASGTTPVEVGGKIKHESGKTAMNSYDTAPGIVLAYQIHVIRTRRAGVETELFSHTSGFLTGEGGQKEDPLVVVDATKEEIDEDLEEEIDYESAQIGEDETCIYLLPKA